MWPLSLGYQYVLVTVFVFFGRLEAFPCWKIAVLLVAKKLLENMGPTWGTASVIFQSRGTHFTGHITYPQESLANFSADGCLLYPTLLVPWPRLFLKDLMFYAQALSSAGE